MAESIFALVGVILGVGLSAGWETWKERRKRAEAKRSVRGELALNLAMIAPKKDILANAHQEIALGSLTPTKTVHFSTVFHDLHLDTIYSELTDLEAQSLHFIRDHIRVIDATMDSLFDDLKADLDRKSPEEVARLYLGLVDNLVSAMDRLEELLRKHLSGTPVAVIDRANQYLATKGA